MLAPLLFAAACASSTVNVRGKELSRYTLSYTDHFLYGITHHDAYPDTRGASAPLRAYAGRITGYACGAEIWAESSYHGGYLGVLGYVEPISRSVGLQSRTSPMHLEIHDRYGERHITGSIGDEIGEMFHSINFLHGAPGDAGEVGAPYYAREHTIDFSFSTSRLHGTVGSRSYDLYADGADNLVGFVVKGAKPLPFKLSGVSNLWSMPPSDQAALLPMLLTCEDEASQADGLVDFELPPILTLDFTRNQVSR
ncbi:MAG TPA: hypothetical protein VGL86_21750 [Polyangia bacterium]